MIPQERGWQLHHGLDPEFPEPTPPWGMGGSRTQNPVSGGDGHGCGGRGAAPAHECLHLKDHFSQELWLHVLSTVDDTTVYQDIASSHSRWHRISAKLPDGAWEPRVRGHPGEASAHLVQSCSGFVWVGVTPPQPTPDLRMRPCGPWDCGRGGSEAGQQYRWRV